MPSVVSGLKAWAENRGGTMFQEPLRGRGWNARPYRKSALRVLSCFAPGLPDQSAQAFADEALTLAEGRLSSMGEFDELVDSTDTLGFGNPEVQLDPQGSWAADPNSDLAIWTVKMAPGQSGTCHRREVAAPEGNFSSSAALR